MTSDELYFFAAEEEQTDEKVVREAWKVLIVDDDEDVHLATKFALSDFSFNGRGLVFYSAYSAKEAKPLLAQHDDFAVAFVDVIMESNHAGLELVKHIREIAQNKLLRIVLRTGQPGVAPENSVIVDYDINDYKTKTELTASRLFSTMVTSLRSYQDLTSLNTAKIGLHKIAYGSSDLFNYHSMKLFAEGVITQLSGLFDMASNGLVLAKNKVRVNDAFEIIIATGQLASDIEHGQFEASSNELILDALRNRKSCYHGVTCALYIPSVETEDDIVVYCQVDRAISPLEIELIEVLSRNITLGFDNVHMVEELRTMVFSDGLTKLKNRHGCMFDAQKSIQNRSTFHLVLLDIQNFSIINSYFGNQIGNDILLGVADCLTGLLTKRSELYRMNGDVFAIMVKDTWQETQKIIQSITDKCKSGLQFNDLTIPITFSFGCAFQDVEVSVKAFEQAEVALSTAKESKNNGNVLFDEVMNINLESRIKVLKDLYLAIPNEEFFMLYQPKVCSKTGCFVGAEALIRWRAADGSFISPADFIPIAEQSGHIIELGDWVINSVFAQAKKWQSLLPEGATISFNVSAQQLMEHHFVERLAKAVQRYDVPPSILQVELTETTVMKNIDAAIDKLKELKKLGFSIAIDDFGTGYSSISYLLSIPFDVLKIDRAFVSGIDSSKDLTNLCRIIVEMGHSLGKSIVAEGVETEAELATLRQLDCEVIQGYFYSKPLSVDLLAEYIVRPPAVN